LGDPPGQIFQTLLIVKGYPNRLTFSAKRIDDFVVVAEL
jgi:secreted protein with Ig-like and vWFA domain